MYKVYASERSPFGRIVRMYLQTQKMPFHFEAKDFLHDPQAEKEVAQMTPINRVPVLFDGKDEYLDSRVIMNFLMKKSGARALTVNEENMITASYSLMDTFVTLFLMSKGGFDIHTPNWYIDRQRARIPATLEFSGDWLTTLSPLHDWHYPAMAWYSAFYWATARDFIKIDEYPKHREFLDRFAAATGVAETDFMRATK